ncbi:MAG: hypothetical protein ACF8R7_08510 [Phycisphaerales bacterium JB039]
MTDQPRQDAPQGPPAFPEQNADGVDLTLIRENLKLTPLERVRKAERLRRAQQAASPAPSTESACEAPPKPQPSPHFPEQDVRGVDLSLIRENLKLPPVERIRRGERGRQQALRLLEIGRQHRERRSHSA